jgi:hypothetical protein
MGRRTVRWCGAPWALVRSAVVVGTLAAAALPGQIALADGTPSPYAFAADDRSVTGATDTAGAERLELGQTYRSSLPAGAKVYYALQLDGESDAYVSVTAVPRARATLSTGAGIRVFLQDANGRTCSVESTYFGASRSPRPIVAWGERETFSRRTSCKDGGSFYVVVERVDGTDPSSDEWDLELAPVSEPPLTGSGATGVPSAPTTWDSASPQPLTNEAVRRQGGAGFAEAEPLTQGVWSAELAPGQTLFYAVPVDWGRQIHATAELGSTAEDGTAGGDTGGSGAAGSTAGGGYVSGALTMSLYNPARMPVDDIGIGYTGTQKSESLDPLPPVDYDNRYAGTDRQSAMRFAGSYYLAVHLSAGMAEKYGDQPFGVTLRVTVDGTGQAGPAYAGQSEPRGLFEVTARDRDVAAGGGAAGDDGAMAVVAVAGIGSGTLLLVVLGGWTVVARRRGGGVL